MAARRTTLAGMSASNLNSRSSMGVGGIGPARGAAGGGNNGRMSVAAAKRQSMAVSKPARASMAPSAGRASLVPSQAGGGGGAGGRPSLAPRQSLATGANGRKSSAGVRRSSAYGGGGGTGRTDPRPISDKSYMNASIRVLVEYLSDHGYDQPISAKILTRPSGRDFNNIMSFLFHQYDPSWTTKEPRFEDEVITMLKAMGYPFTLSKASLAAVGAPQTWPKMLAVISWIVELLTYDEEVRAYEADQQERRARGEADGMADQQLDDKMFFDYLGKAYKCFLDGDDEQYGALEEDLVQGYDLQSEQIAAEVKALESRKQKLQADMEECRGRAEQLPLLEARRADLNSDMVKFDQLIQQMTNHRQAFEAKVASRQGEEARLKEDLSANRDQIEVLRNRVMNQELSAEDVQRMAREQQRLRDGMAAAAEHKAASLKRLWEAQVELAKKLEELDIAVHAYNSRAAALLVIPQGAKNANGYNLELAVRRDMVEDEEHLLNNDVKGVIAPALQALKETAIRRMHEARQELLELLDEEEASEEALTELLEQRNVLEAKLKKAEETYRKEKEALEVAAVGLSKDAEAVEMRLTELSDPSDIERGYARATQQLVFLQSEREGAQLEGEREKTKLKDAILEALNVCTDHKERVQKLLSETKEMALIAKEAVYQADGAVSEALQQAESH